MSPTSQMRGVGVDGAHRLPGLVEQAEGEDALEDRDQVHGRVGDPEPGGQHRQARADGREQGQQRSGHDDVQDHHDDEAGDAPPEQAFRSLDVARGRGGVAGCDEGCDGAEDGEGAQHRHQASGRAPR